VTGSTIRTLTAQRWNSLVPAVAVIALSIACMVVPIDPQLVEQAGYLGVFVVTLLATGALVLPMPYLAVIARAATLLDPISVAVLAGVAAAIGELTGYALGRSGRGLIPDNRWVETTRAWMNRHGFATVTVAAFIPNPAFDAVGALAGAVGYAPWRFCVACFIGKTAKFLLIGLAASGVVTWMSG
jgi:membrane protein YqaA with SNARE-associated domain